VRARGTSEHSFHQWRKRLAEQLPMKFALAEPPQRTCRAETDPPNEPCAGRLSINRV